METAFPIRARVRGLAEASFEFLNAKLRARRSAFYEGDRLRALTSEPDILSLARRLFPGRDVADQFQLERHMTAACMADLASVARYLCGPYLRLYRALLDLYPVEDLKVLLRLWEGREEAPEPADLLREAQELLVELPTEYDIPVEGLLSSESAEQFARGLAPGPVREAIEAALPLYKRTGVRAYLEMAADGGYWRGVAAALAGLRRRERAQLASPIELECDAMRLLAVLRGAVAYQMPWGHLVRLLPPGPGRLETPMLQRFHDDPDPAAAARELGPALGASLQADRIEDVGDLEEALWRETVRLARRQFRTVLAGPAVLVSHFYLKRDELRRLLSLTQMLRYGRTPAGIREYLDL